MDEMIIGGKGIITRVSERFIRKAIKDKFNLNADISIEEMKVKGGDDFEARLCLTVKIPGKDILAKLAEGIMK